MSGEDHSWSGVSLRTILLGRLRSPCLLFTEFITPLLLALMISWIGAQLDASSFSHTNISDPDERIVIGQLEPVLQYNTLSSNSDTPGRVDLFFVKRSQDDDVRLVLQSIQALVAGYNEEIKQGSQGSREGDGPYRHKEFDNEYSADIYLAEIRCAVSRYVPDLVVFDQVNISSGLLTYRIKASSLESPSSWPVKATTELATRSQYSSQFIDLVYLVNRAFLDSFKAESLRPGEMKAEKDLDIEIYGIPFPSYRLAISAHHFDFVIVFYCMAFCFPYLRMIRQVSHENHKRLRATDRACLKYWATIITFYSWQMFLIGFLMTSILKIKVLSFSILAHSNYFLMICIFFVYSLHLVTFGLLISVIFSDTDLCSLLSACLFVATFVLPRNFSDPSEKFTENSNTMRLACILPNAALYLALKIIILFESRGSGLTLTTLTQATFAPSGLSVASILPVMTVSSLIFLLLTIYLDLVWPCPLAKKTLPFLFLCDRNYWRGQMPEKSNQLTHYAGPKKIAHHPRTESGKNCPQQTHETESGQGGSPLSPAKKAESSWPPAEDNVGSPDFVTGSQSSHDDLEGMSDDEPSEEDFDSMAPSSGSMKDKPVITQLTFTSLMGLLHIILLCRIHQAKMHRSLWFTQLILPMLLLGGGSRILAFFELGDSSLSVDYSFASYPKCRVAIQTDGSTESEEFKNYLVRSMELDDIHWYTVENNSSNGSIGLFNHYRQQIESNKIPLEEYIEKNIVGLHVATQEAKKQNANVTRRRITGWVNNEATHSVPLLLKLIFEAHLLETRIITGQTGRISFSTDIYRDSEDREWASLCLAGLIWICLVAVSLALIAASTIILPLDQEAPSPLDHQFNLLHPSLQLAASFASDIFLFFVMSILMICGIFVLTEARLTLVDASDYLAAFALIMSFGSTSILISYLLVPYYDSKTEAFTHVFIIYTTIGVTATAFIFATELTAQLDIISNFMHQLIAGAGQFIPIVAATWAFRNIFYNNAYAYICSSIKESKLSNLCLWTAQSKFHSQMYRACCRTDCYDDRTRIDHCYYLEPFGWSSHQINRQLWLMITVAACILLIVLFYPIITAYRRRLSKTFPLA